ncbi:WD repeat-containing protein 67 [Cricetulus griseus]|uniref:WD repeat-containing protein 67 n=1 Tax=Cricetulus griseus TaxID=10029 RepID=G3INC7_CRIGR|nr:WD repeat-containing protein 67 [Cricetulus griseus]
MRGHESSVFSISVHASGRYAITTSSDTAQLWDLDTFQRKRKLNIRQSVGIQKVSGLPLPLPRVAWSQDSEGTE